MASKLGLGRRHHDWFKGNSWLEILRNVMKYEFLSGDFSSAEVRTG
jgi:hypothetical protein